MHDLPQFTCDDPLPKRDHRRHESPPVGDLEGHPALGGNASGLLDLLPCQPGRLLAQDGNPGGKCSAGDFCVAIRRGRHENPIRPPGGEQVRERRVQPMSAAPQYLSNCFDRLDHVGHADRGRPPSCRVEGPQVHAPHPTRTDQGKLHKAIGHGGQDVSSGGIRYPLPQLRARTTRTVDVQHHNAQPITS
jgi:hypothetical protein